MRIPDLGRAMRAVWWITSLIGAALLAAPFLLDPATDRWIPVCESRARFDRPCPLCGMTTSFRAIAGGRWDDAREANRAGPSVYAALSGNALLLLAIEGRRLRRRRLRPPPVERSPRCTW